MNASLTEIILVVLLGATVGACQPPLDPLPDAAHEAVLRTGTAWVLTSLRPAGGRPASPAAGETYTLRFDTDNTLSGLAVCNAFSAPYAQPASGRLSIGPVQSSLALCSQGALITPYLDALARAATYEATGDHLRIDFEGGGVLTFKADLPH